MKIVLSSRLSGHGGVAVYNRTLARALIDLGHDVTIVTSNDTAGATLRKVERDGVSTVLIPTGISRFWRRLPGLRYYARSWNHRAYSRELDRWLGSLKGSEIPDVVEFAEVGGEGYFYTRRAKRSAVVVRCHTPTFILRKHHVAGEMTYDTRLVGRSVWNTRWLLIIPGGTLNADAAAGLDTFVRNISDIKLFFQTYGFSGN